MEDNRKHQRRVWQIQFSSLAIGVKDPVEIITYHKEGMPKEHAGIHVSFRGHTITHLLTAEELMFYKNAAVTAGKVDSPNGISYYE